MDINKGDWNFGIPSSEEPNLAKQTSARESRDQDSPSAPNKLCFSDVLAAIENEQLSVIIDVFLGAIEVGRMELLCGVITHAEVPGEIGNGALKLLAEMPRAELCILPASPDSLKRQTVTSSLWEHFEASILSPADMAPRLASWMITRARVAVGGKRKTEELPFMASEEPDLGFSDPSTVEQSPISDKDRRQEKFDPLFQQAMGAYMKRDYGEALKLFEACAELRPDSSRVRQNIAKIKNRGI